MIRISNANENIIFSQDGFTLDSIEFGAFKINENIDERFFSSLKDFSLENGRDITIKGTLSGGIVSEKKRKVCRICTAISGFTLVEDDYKMECVLSGGIKFSPKKAFEEKVCTFEIKAFCPSPFWSSFTPNVYRFLSCSGASAQNAEFVISNSGDTDVGFIAEIEILSSMSAVTLLLNGKKLCIEKAFSIGNIITVNTQNGTVLFSEGYGQAKSDIISNVTYDSEMLYLKKGENRVGYAFIGGGVNCTFLVYPRYAR